MIEFTLKSGAHNKPFIELNKLLKVTQLCESGAVANQSINDGFVKLNGNIESRKRAKIKQGDKVEFKEVIITVI